MSYTITHGSLLCINKGADYYTKNKKTAVAKGVTVPLGGDVCIAFGINGDNRRILNGCFLFYSMVHAIGASWAKCIL